MTIKEMPDSEYCFETHIFSESKECPDYNDTLMMAPECKKYGKTLSWTRSGVAIKCEECRRKEGEG